MQRDILHVVIPAFPIALARVVDASLRARPVIAVPGHSERALVQCASAEARAEGVCEGMPVYRAMRRCPSLRLIPPDPQLLSRGMQGLLDLAARYSPISETASQGRLFLDVTGSRRLMGPARDIASRLDRDIAAQLRLCGTVGVAGNKLVSRIASDFLEKPGVCDVLRGAERSFIGPLPVSVLPGVGQARQAVLMQDLNLQRVEEVAALSSAQLRLAFGPFALLLHQRACGYDPTPVQPPRRTSELSQETFLGEEGNDDQVLLAELYRLVEDCGWRLRRTARQAGCLALTVTYADGVAMQRSSSLPAPASHDLLLFAAAEELFRQVCMRRVRVKGLKIVCTGLVPEPRQLELFSGVAGAAPHHVALQNALDCLRARHGRASIHWGRTLYR